MRLPETLHIQAFRHKISKSLDQQGGDQQLTVRGYLQVFGFFLVMVGGILQLPALLVDADATRKTVDVLIMNDAAFH